MDNCDCCGVQTDERAMESVGKFSVCQSCAGYYSDDELIERIENGTLAQL